LESLFSTAISAKVLAMLNLKEVRQRREEIVRLAEKYHASNVRVFGSVARGVENPDSDIDILINTEPGCTLFDLGGLLANLEDLLGGRVDLVAEDGLKESIRSSVLREAVPL
jgi:uncharacterized protein